MLCSDVGRSASAILLLMLLLLMLLMSILLLILLLILLRNVAPVSQVRVVCFECSGWVNLEHALRIDGSIRLHIMQLHVCHLEALLAGRVAKQPVEQQSP